MGCRTGKGRLEMVYWLGLGKRHGWGAMLELRGRELEGLAMNREGLGDVEMQYRKEGR